MRSHCLALCLVLVVFLHIASSVTRDDFPINLSDSGEAAKRSVSSWKAEVQEAERRIEEETQNGGSVHSIRVKRTSKEEFQKSKNSDELVYDIDYHGVTTHPSPSPKHPIIKH